MNDKCYAETIAEALAPMHWGTGMDANDVEFELAPPRVSHGRQGSTFQSEFLGEHCLWLLDFDCCHEIQMDEEGIEQAYAVFFGNYPYYPRPQTGDTAGEELWMVFKQKLLECSQLIVGEENLWLAKLIEQLEEEGAARRKRREVDITQEA